MSKSKYEPLKTFLIESGRSEIPIEFREIEAIIGCKLPAKASGYPAWWSNNPSNNPMTRAWLNAGYKSESVDTKNRKLIFRKQIEAAGEIMTAQIRIDEDTRTRLEELATQLKRSIGEVVRMLSYARMPQLLELAYERARAEIRAEDR